MAAIIVILVAAGLGIWFGRRLGPALLAALLVLAAPAWLVFGFIGDLLRMLPAGLRRIGIAAGRLLGALLVLPMLPFIFVWAFFAELIRPAVTPAKPLQAASKQTAQVIDLATARSRRERK